MILKKDFKPYLTVGETTITDRDIEMFRAIDQFGSMQKAADQLGRSYPHLQRRVVELEKAIGDLTRRVRGGEGGGGTQLTPDALDLIQQFERLRIRLSGTVTVPESVIYGTVVDQYGNLATVRTDAGDITARVPSTVKEVEIAVRADTVVLMMSQSSPDRHTSLQNQISGIVSEITIDETIATVTIEITDNTTLQSIVTEESVDQLDLENGTEVIAAFKTTAARAIPMTSSST